MKKIWFAENLKFLREKKGLKQSEMIDNVGFKQTTWNGYETGKSFPKFEDLLKISEYFDISESDLIHIDLKFNTSSLNKSASKTINTDYKELAESRLETNDSLKRENASKDKTISSLEQINDMQSKEIARLQQEKQDLHVQLKIESSVQKGAMETPNKPSFESKLGEKVGK
jgi:transcriptional regulator with XRE-family HTH domain